MKEIPLSQGKVALVDDEDYDRLAAHNWYASKDGRTYYARRRDGRNGPTRVMHRVILDAEAQIEVDHINGNGLDNRRSNLRPCTRKENGRSRRATRKPGQHSAHKGVIYNVRAKKWRAYIYPDGRNTHLGYFKDEIDAALAYDAAAVRYFGAFARVNFPREGENQA